MDVTERKRILFLGGALNQTKIAHAVSRYLEDDYETWFSPFYADSLVLGTAQRAKLLDWTALGGTFKEMSLDFLSDVGARVDEGGCRNSYDLVVTTSDLILQKNLAAIPKVLLQEGMTDPENLMYHAVTKLRLPRYLASTSTNGLSLAYDLFCVASEGYKEHFMSKGVPGEKLVVTGLPHWDDFARAVDGSSFPHQGYVLVATSDARETLKLEYRKRFLRRAVRIAAGRPMIFKLHPNEQVERATREICQVAPDALVLAEGDINPMIANCDELITQYSTVVYTGMALGKPCHSYFDMDELGRLLPMQNGGTSAARMAQVCRHVLERRDLLDRRALVDVCACRDCDAGAIELHAAAG
jgi:hypothetical protein